MLYTNTPPPINPFHELWESLIVSEVSIRGFHFIEDGRPRWDRLMLWHRRQHNLWSRENDRILHRFRRVISDLELYLDINLFAGRRVFRKRTDFKIVIGGSRMNDLFTPSSDIDCKVVIPDRYRHVINCLNDDIRDKIIDFFLRGDVLYRFKLPPKVRYTTTWHLKLVTLEEVYFDGIIMDVDFVLMSETLYNYASAKWDALNRAQYPTVDDRILYSMNRHYFKLVGYVDSS